MYERTEYRWKEVTREHLPDYTIILNFTLCNTKSCCDVWWIYNNNAILPKKKLIFIILLGQLSASDIVIMLVIFGSKTTIAEE